MRHAKFVLLIATFVALFTTSEVDAGIFGRRCCLPRRSSTCPKSAPSFGGTVVEQVTALQGDVANLNLRVGQLEAVIREQQRKLQNAPRP